MFITVDMIHMMKIFFGSIEIKVTNITISGNRVSSQLVMQANISIKMNDIFNL